MIAPPPTVLTIAGSDPSAGAGIQADLKTCAALGVYGMSVITALTAQNTLGVSGVHEVPAPFVASQIDAIFADIVPGAVKTGMLANAAIVQVVAEKARQYGFRNLVVDTVIVSSSGARLLAVDGVRAMREMLIPLAEVLTPNLPEAEALLGRKLEGDDDYREATREMHSWGARNVVLKGGHQTGESAVDLLFDGVNVHEFAAPRIDTTSTHGSGCAFASAIACYLAQGRLLTEAVAGAKAYVTEAIRRAQPLGHGHGPVNHFWNWPA